MYLQFYVQHTAEIINLMFVIKDKSIRTNLIHNFMDVTVSVKFSKKMCTYVKFYDFPWISKHLVSFVKVLGLSLYRLCLLHATLQRIGEYYLKTVNV